MGNNPSFTKKEQQQRECYYSVVVLRKERVDEDLHEKKGLGLTILWKIEVLGKRRKIKRKEG